MICGTYTLRELATNVVHGMELVDATCAWAALRSQFFLVFLLRGFSYISRGGIYQYLDRQLVQQYNFSDVGCLASEAVNGWKTSLQTVSRFYTVYRGRQSK